MSKLRKWLKGQKSKQKEPKSKDDKFTPESGAVAHTRQVQAVSAESGNVTTPRQTLRDRILASGLQTKTNTPNRPDGITSLQNIITVIPEGRKEIHMSVSELGKVTSRAVVPRPVPNQRTDDILASMNKARESTPSQAFPATSSVKRDRLFSQTQRGYGQTSRSQVVDSTPVAPTKAAPLSPPKHSGRVWGIKFDTSPSFKADGVGRSSKPRNASAFPTEATSASPTSKDNGAKVPLNKPTKPITSQPIGTIPVSTPPSTIQEPKEVAKPAAKAVKAASIPGSTATPQKSKEHMGQIFSQIAADVAIQAPVLASHSPKEARKPFSSHPVRVAPSLTPILNT